jgi:hypothetical protein
MTPIRDLPNGLRQAREIGREAQANDLSFYECQEDIAHYYGKTWDEMSENEKADCRREFRNGKAEEKESSAQ